MLSLVSHSLYRQKQLCLCFCDLGFIIKFSALNSRAIVSLSTQAPAGSSLLIKAVFHQHLCVSCRRYKTTASTMTAREREEENTVTSSGKNWSTVKDLNLTKNGNTTSPDPPSTKNDEEIGNQRDRHQDIINMAKFKDNEVILKTVREKQKVTKKGTPIRL